jgi:hypothetical protein
MEEL